MSALVMELIPLELAFAMVMEASGIAIASFVADRFGCPVLFAKKSKTRNLADEGFFTTKVVSFTHNNTSDVIVAKRFLSETDRVLIIDDFLANGEALRGMIDLCDQAGATVVGCGIAIEKAFQPGGDMIREKGIRVESLARIRSMDDDGHIEFCK